MGSHAATYSHVADASFFSHMLQAELAYTTALELLHMDGIAGTEIAMLYSNRAAARLMVRLPDWHALQLPARAHKLTCLLMCKRLEHSEA